jgi:hypothetical protein
MDKPDHLPPDVFEAHYHERDDAGQEIEVTIKIVRHVRPALATVVDEPLEPPGKGG